MPVPTIVDLRSDTVTRPSAGMRRAIAEAPVGDDVLGDDPTVQALQARAAALLGKEAALFTPSGTMANQIGIRVHTFPGDEILCHAHSHVVLHESGAPAALSGASTHLLPGQRGQFDAATLRAALQSPDVHHPRSRLVVLENTHNRGGGSVWPLERFSEVAAAAREAELAVHLDGARLMNACVASGHRPADYARHADTTSLCFSKGLGAPVGSVLAGPEELIRRARRFRKMFGGGMRQAGILAAAALYALDHNVDRLADDHARARRLALGLAEIPGIRIDPTRVETNIVYFEIAPELGSAARFCGRCEAEGAWMLPDGTDLVRAVTHLDITGEHIDLALRVVRGVASRRGVPG